jgi:poly(hydroxyalkanoate) depolymerase family esterase
MNAFSKIDMGEVTRLTHAGKLTEAMALLQGHTASSIARGRPGSEVPRLTQGIKRPSPPLPTIDMVAPSAPGGAWTAPTQFKQRADGESIRPVKAVGPPDLAQMMPAFRGLPRLGPLSSVDGFGRPRQAPVHVPEGARFEERTFSNDVGSRTYKVYVPSGYSCQSLPVVVMLHGCTQNPDDFAAGTRMNEVAEEQTFLVAYPRQPQSANMQKCWNWFNAGDQQREGGEPSLIAGIAMQVVVEEFSADPARVYVAGLSAGGAAAAIMAATYPDIFAAVDVHSGLACGGGQGHAVGLRRHGRERDDSAEGGRTDGADHRLPWRCRPDGQPCQQRPGHRPGKPRDGAHQDGDAWRDARRHGLHPHGPTRRRRRRGP